VLAVPGALHRVGPPPRPVPALADRLDTDHRAVLEASPTVDVGDLHRARASRAAAAAAVRRPPDRSVEREDHDAGGVRVRTYRPQRAPAPGPALLWMHGGGLVMGDLAEDDAECEELALGGRCLVASVDYRLAPEHPYPAAVDDCLTAARWLAAQAPALGVDRSRIAVGGYSAGAGLAAATCLLARDRAVLSPVLQVLLAPMLDDRRRPHSAPPDLRVWHEAANTQAWGHYLGGAAGRDAPDPAAPARAGDLGGLPPAYLAIGDLDLFLDETLEYAAQLVAAGVPVDLRVHAGAFHGSSNRVPRSDLSRRWQEDRDAALRRALQSADAW
jgi:acetyl esterase/lipase